MEQFNSSNQQQGKNKAYLSIVFGITPIILALILLAIGRPSTHPAISFWVSSMLFVTLTAPLCGIIGIVLAKCAERDDRTKVLTNIGFICSTINIIITSIPAIILLLFIIAGG